MGEIANQQRTVVLVSHNLQAIGGLCDKCCWLDGGLQTYFGDVNECIRRYTLHISGTLPEEVDTETTSRSSELINSTLKILRVRMEGRSGKALLPAGEPITVEIVFRCEQKVSSVIFGISISSIDNVRIFECRSVDGLDPMELERGVYRIQCSLRNILTPGNYYISVGARTLGNGLDYVPNTLQFQVEDNRKYKNTWFESTAGYVRMKSEWKVPSLV